MLEETPPAYSLFRAGTVIFSRQGFALYRTHICPISYTFPCIPTPCADVYGWFAFLFAGPHAPSLASDLPRPVGKYVQLKILIVDDNSAIRHLIRTFIETHTDWQVCGEAENGQVAIERAIEQCPDVVILDFSMPVMNGLDAARQILHKAPNMAILLFTMHTSEQLRKDAANIGIRHVVSKSDSLEDCLLPSLKKAAGF